MAATFIPIQSITLTGSAASVTFSAIPQTYTDLVLRCSVRDDSGAYVTTLQMRFNGTTSGYSLTRISATPSGASSTRYTNQNILNPIPANGGTATANTFGSAEMLIPNYTAAAYKPIGMHSVLENNSSTEFVQDAAAGLWSNTAAVTSIYLTTGSNFVAGCTFHLYGIKNS